MKYSANFKASNGTRMANPITSTNKKRLIKDIKEIARGYKSVGEIIDVYVFDESDICIYHAFMGRYRKVFRRLD